MGNKNSPPFCEGGEQQLWNLIICDVLDGLDDLFHLVKACVYLDEDGFESESFGFAADAFVAFNRLTDSAVGNGLVQFFGSYSNIIKMPRELKEDIRGVLGAVS